MEDTKVSEKISEEITSKVHEIIEEWQLEEGNLIMILHDIQDHYGYVPRNISMFLSQKLNVPLAKIYEVLTFYNYFKLEPPAKYTVQICTGTACYLKGSTKLVEEFKKQLKIPAKLDYTEDKEFKIEEVRCIGCCGLAPVLTVNEEVFGRVKPEQVSDIINQFKTKK